MSARSLALLLAAVCFWLAWTDPGHALPWAFFAGAMFQKAVGGFVVGWRPGRGWFAEPER